MNEIEMLDSLVDWCRTARHKIGAVDGYDYRSGEEAGLANAQGEIEKRLKALRASAPETRMPDREVIARAAAQALGRDYDKLKNFYFTEDQFCKNDFLRAADAILALAPADPAPSTAITKSPPLGSAPHNSGERLPSSNAATCGGDTTPPAAAPEPEPCGPLVCEAARTDGVICADDECDRVNGVRPAAAPDQGVREALGDLQSHLGSWKQIMTGVAETSARCNDPDDSSYIRHEIKVLERVVAALSRPAPDAAGSEWKEISTAPKDGTQVIVWPYWADNKPAQVYWRDMKRSPGRWEITPSFFCAAARPTHWQHIQSPPVVPRQEGKTP